MPIATSGMRDASNGHVMPGSRLLIRCWGTEVRRCVLWYEDDVLEVRLYDKGQLVALQPCETLEQVFDLSVLWRQHPPRWPPF